MNEKVGCVKWWRWFFLALALQCGCRHAVPMHVMAFDDYMAVLPEDAKKARSPFLVGNDRDYRKLSYWYKSENDEWTYEPLWVVAEVFYTALGNSYGVFIDVKYVSAYKVSWFMCLDPDAMIKLVDFSPAADNKLFNLFREHWVPSSTGVLCALRILPTRKKLGTSRARVGCIVQEAFLIESFQNKLLDKWQQTPWEGFGED